MVVSGSSGREAAVRVVPGEIPQPPLRQRGIYRDFSIQSPGTGREIPVTCFGNSYKGTSGRLHARCFV